MDYRWIMLLFTCWLAACTADTAPASAPPPPQAADVDIADIVRSPIADENAPTDTTRAARMAFEATTIDFGSIRAGRSVRRTYSFRNTGKLPLLITDARSTCGCTIPSYPEAPVAPGEKGEIEVVFNTKGKAGRQRKPIVLTANTYPARTTLYLAGRVIKK